jgi:hypothetical protein
LVISTDSYYDARIHEYYKEYKIKMGIQEVVCWGMDWINLAQDMDRWQTLVNAVMNLRVP